MKVHQNEPGFVISLCAGQLEVELRCLRIDFQENTTSCSNCLVGVFMISIFPGEP